MGADKSAAITTNAPKFVCPSPKVWDFYDKMLHWASVVRATAAAALRYLTIEIHIPCEKSVLYFLQ